MGGGHQRWLVFVSVFQMFIVPLCLGALLACGTPGALHENSAGPGIPLARGSTLAFAAGDVVAWAGAYPRGQFSPVGELFDVRTGLGNNRCGGDFLDSIHALCQFGRLTQSGMRVYMLADLFVQFRDFLLQKCQMLHRMSDQLTMMIRHAMSFQSLLQ